MFCDLLHPAMEIADHTLRAQHFFAIQLQDDAQHSMRRRMLWAHIDDEFVAIEKSFLVFLQLQVKGGIGHCPLSIPRLICTHS